MTENEAKLLEKLDELANDTEVDMYSVATLNAFFEECGNTIRGLFEEIQQYRAIGTVEDWKRLIEKEATERRKLAEYFMFGSVEEFKDLKEKSVAKKAIVYGHNDAVGTDVGLCPVCNDRPLRACDNQYCPDCGQKLDWSE